MIERIGGGGEPYRAPRDRLLQLIRFAIDHRARYVVLDVIIESRDDPDDEAFVQAIDELDEERPRGTRPASPFL